MIGHLNIQLSLNNSDKISLKLKCKKKAGFLVFNYETGHRYCLLEFEYNPFYLFPRFSDIWTIFPSSKNLIKNDFWNTLLENSLRCSLSASCLPIFCELYFHLECTILFLYCDSVGFYMCDSFIHMIKFT